MQNDTDQVMTRADLDRFDRRRVTVVGVYRAITQPIKGAHQRDAEKDRAVLQLDDGTEIFLEPLDSLQSRRAAAETREFDGKRVCVEGTAHALMPARGESLVAPCLVEVTSICEDRPR